MTWREGVIHVLVGIAAFTAVSTEALGAFRLIRPVPLMVLWVVAFAVLMMLSIRRGWRPRMPRFWSSTGVDLALTAGIVAILGAVMTIALVSPPNSTDAMAYHLPRVLYWSQAHSVHFLPVHYYAQVMWPPLAEYVVLHTYVLSGGDQFANVVQFSAFFGCIVAVSLIAREFGSHARGQVVAAVCCATLPNAILQASGAKNDLVLSFFLTAIVWYGLQLCSGRSWWVRTGFGLSIALAMFTKGTAYVFVPVVVAAVFLIGLLREPDRWREWMTTAVFTCALVLVINGPLYVRNYFFSGSPLGYASAAPDGQFHIRNDRLNWRVTASNIVRHLSDQLSARSDHWNRGVYDAAIALHKVIGIDADDPATTWKWTRFEAPRNSNHETNANNHWHLLLFVLTALGAYWLAPRELRLEWFVLLAAVVAAFVLFCSLLRWQPYMQRMFAPLFVLMTALIGVVLGHRRLRFPQIVVCLLLLYLSRPYVFSNWVRPLRGPQNIFTVSRDDQYFADMTSWHDKADYLRAVDRTLASGCRRVGIDNEYLQLEYPYEAILKERDASFLFAHSGVKNASARYPQDPAFTPCAVLCLDCAGKPDKMALYSGLGPPEQIGLFLFYAPR